jgi:hypothetical protein
MHAALIQKLLTTIPKDRIFTVKQIERFLLDHQAYLSHRGAPPNPISFPSRSRYVILRTPFE